MTASLVQLLAWLLGRAAANQRSFNQLTAEYHEHRVQEQAALAHATVAQAERAVVQERLRIAQELHDVVAHSMSVIAVQAGAGHHIAAKQPKKAAAALAAIEGASRDALQEMRRLLGVLRGPEELVPAPGLADLPALVQATARAGVEVDLRLEGAERVLPAGLELTAYRIVQEALTNVVKHAGTDHSRVVVTYQRQHLSIEVTDDGRGPKTPAVVRYSATGGDLRRYAGVSSSLMSRQEGVLGGSDQCRRGPNRVRVTVCTPRPQRIY